MIAWIVAIGFCALWFTEIAKSSELQCIIDERNTTINRLLEEIEVLRRVK